MGLRQEIFAEIKRLKLRQGYIWKFQSYNPFISKLFISLQEFSCVMNDLCNKNIFEKEQDYIINSEVIYRYRLTAQGESLIWYNI